MVKKVKKKKTFVMSKKRKTGSVSKKDFETFKFGVERLKELEKELDGKMDAVEIEEAIMELKKRADISY